MEPERRTDSGGKRRPVDVLLLILNVTIVIVGVVVVWEKWRERSGLGDRETPVLQTGLDDPPAARDGTGTGTGGDAEPDRDPVVDAPDGATLVPGPPDSLGETPRIGADAPVTPPPVTPPPVTPPPVTAPVMGAADGPLEPRAGTAPTEVPRVRGHVNDVVSPAPVSLAPDARAATDHDALLALAATEAAIDGVGVDLEVLRTIRAAYPSSTAAYGTNRGIEALHVALAKVGKVARLRLGDTDDDGRMEILDAWGRPLVYFSPDDYDSRQRWAPGDAEASELTACRARAGDRALGGFEAVGSYQLWSVGPDGCPDDGRGDDITSWVRRD